MEKDTWENPAKHEQLKQIADGIANGARLTLKSLDNSGVEYEFPEGKEVLVWLCMGQTDGYAKNYQKNMKVLMEKFKDLLIGQSDCNGREEFTDYGLRMIAFPKLTAKNWLKYLKSKNKWKTESNE